MRRRICRLRSALTLLCFWLPCVSSMGAIDACAQSGGQLVIYLEVSDSSPREERILMVEAARLVGREGVVDLRPLAQQLSSKALSVRQARFVDQAIAPDLYRNLEVDFGIPQDPEEPEEVERTFRPGRLGLSLDLEIVSGQCGFVRLVWDPDELDLKDGVLEPSFRVVRGDLPAVGARAYVANGESGNLTILDRITHRIVGVVMTGTKPNWISSSTLLNRFYVACAGSDEVLEFDLTDLTPLRRVSLPFGDRPSRLLLSVENRRLIVANPGSNTVVILDLDSLQEISRIIVGETPRGLEVDPMSGRLFVASELSNEIQIYEIATGEEVPGFGGVHSPSELALDEQSDVLFVASRSERQVLGVELGTGSVVSRTRLRGGAGWLGFNPRLDRLYAAIQDSREIVMLKPDREIEAGSFPLASAPGFPAFDLDYTRIFVPLPAADRVIVLDAKTGRVIGEAEVGANPQFVEVPK